MLLADPFTFPADEFLAWLAEAPTRACRWSGGTPRAGAGPGGSRLVVGDRVVTAGAAGVLIGRRGRHRDRGLPGVPGLRATPLTVTRSDRNVIYEVAGVPAMECMVDQITEQPRPGRDGRHRVQRAASWAG